MILWEINPEERTIRSVDLETLPVAYGDDPCLLDAETGDVLYRDRTSSSTFAFVIDGIRAPVVGVAYISGTNANGDDVPPKGAYDSLVNGIDFGKCVGDMFMGDTIIRGLQR